MRTPDDTFQWGTVRFVPIVHNRMEFALEVRRQMEAFRPDAVAVEYPPTIEGAVLGGVKRLPLLSVVHYGEEDGTLVYLTIEPTDGQVEAIRLALERGLSVHFVDRDTEGYPFDRSPMPDPYAVARIGHAAYCRAYLRSAGGASSAPQDVLRERTMAFHLRALSRSGRRILFVGGLYHLPGILEHVESPQTEVIGRRRRQGVALAHLHEESSREVMTEIPFLAAAYESFRSGENASPPDRLEVHQALIRAAREGYWKNSREELNHNQVRVLNRFARNYALITGGLAPDFYQLVVASRGAADDNFAYEVWEKGSAYPWQTDDPGIPVLTLRGEDLFLDQKRIRFHRRIKSFRHRLIPVPARKKVAERDRAEWKRDFEGLQICSYPPEDVVVEGYGTYLKRRALEIKTEENTRSVPFTSSMLDGLDVRRTLREWHTGNLYVREERPVRGRVGSVVVIFDPDLPKERTGREEAFPWCVTWLGEHSQESDMAFYSTPAGAVMEGPGISRCQYGGFMLTYPPLRVFDIWRDDFFGMARSKPERLLLAALDYSLEKNVVYVSADPPSGWCRSLAARLGKRILYLPIGVFSPVTLKKIRQFHVLDGHHVRRYARQFIGGR